MSTIDETRYDNDGKAIHNGTTPEPINERYLLEQINAIAAGTSYVLEALHSLEKLEVGHELSGVDGGGYAVQSKAEAIADIVKARETTNQQLIRLLEKMYDNAHRQDTSPKMDNRISRFDSFCESLRKFVDEDGNYPSEVLGVLRDTSMRIFE